MTQPLSFEAVSSFLESVDIPEPEFHAFESDEEADLIPPDFSDAIDQSVAVGSQIAGFTSDFDTELRQTVVNVFLIAQLAADKLIRDEGGDTEKWYTKYIDTLGGLGMLDEDRGFTLREISGAAVQVHKEIIPVLTAVLGPAVAAASAVVAVLNGLASMDENSKWITLFDRSSQRAQANQFQMSHAYVENGVQKIKLVAFELSASRSVLQVLFFRFGDSHAHLRQFSKSVVVNTQLLRQIGPGVAAKLGERTLEMVADIEI